MHVLNYVNDMLYYGTHDAKVKEFEEQLNQWFNLELMGQNQLANFDMELDQSRYCLLNC
jgi:hypothetical protein